MGHRPKDAHFSRDGFLAKPLSTTISFSLRQKCLSNGLRQQEPALLHICLKADLIVFGGRHVDDQTVRDVDEAQTKIPSRVGHQLPEFRHVEMTMGTIATVVVLRRPRIRGWQNPLDPNVGGVLKEVLFVAGRDGDPIYAELVVFPRDDARHTTIAGRAHPLSPKITPG